jgi:cytochrome b
VSADTSHPAIPAARERRWDPLVRVTHWGVAGAIVANGLITREGSDWHVWVGYAAAALLGLRLLWGVLGPAEARFSAFPPSPARAVAHVRDLVAGRRTEHRSHNPLGALMVYALWETLGLVAATGIAMAGPPQLGARPATDAAAPLMSIKAIETDAEDDDEAEGDGAGESGGEGGDEVLEEIHEAAANLLFVLAGLHVAGVAFETRRSGGQVLRAMSPWRRRVRPA